MCIFSEAHTKVITEKVKYLSVMKGGRPSKLRVVLA